MSDTSAVSLFRRPWQEWVTLAARLILGVTLLVAGLLKVTQLDASILSVRLYQLLPWDSTTFIGIALPILEVAMGLLLITGTFTRISAVVGSLLMVAFIFGIASVWARGISIDCGCFGGGGAIEASLTQYPLEILRDTGLLLTGAWTVWRPRAPFAVDNWLLGPVDEVDPETETIAADDKESIR
ncbi:MAG: DoxX family protein [Propionicimonas sp.]